MSRGQLVKKAVVKTIPVMSGYIVLGMGFGIILEESGYGVIWALLMSMFIYAGSMQFVAINLITSGASLIATALTTLMVNARHLFYGISMIEKYKGAGKKKPYLMFALTDETYSLVCTGEAPEGADYHQFCLAVSALNQFYWVLGSVIGSLAGQAITFDTTGLDFAMTALFVTVFVDQWKTAKNHLPALVGIGASVVCLLIFGSGNFLIPSMIAITVILSLGKNKMDVKGEDDNE